MGQSNASVFVVSPRHSVVRGRGNCRSRTAMWKRANRAQLQKRGEWPQVPHLHNHWKGGTSTGEWCRLIAFAKSICTFSIHTKLQNCKTINGFLQRKFKLIYLTRFV